MKQIKKGIWCGDECGSLDHGFDSSSFYLMDIDRRKLPAEIYHKRLDLPIY
jgi:hypothetical protein